MKCWAFFPLSYIVVGFLTFALVYDSTEKESDRNYHHDTDAFGAVIAGGVWPIYWGGKGALYAVRSTKTEKPKGCVYPNNPSLSFYPDQDGYCRFKADQSQAR